MDSNAVLGRAAVLSLFALALTALPAAAGPLPDLDVTAGMRPAAALRSLATRARADAALRRVATPASFDERYDVPTFVWAKRSSSTATATTRARATSPEAAARTHLGLVSGYYRLQ